MSMLTTLPSLYLYFGVGILSVLVGSVLNVIIHRLPTMIRKNCSNTALSDTECQRQHKHINLFFPLSFCPTCLHPIRPWHNIPILSYCLLLGRCAYCRKSISWRYPLVECMTFILSLCALFIFSMSAAFVFSLIFIGLLICLCFIDLEHGLLPDPLNYSLLWVGLMANTMGLFSPMSDAVFGAVIAYLSLWSLTTLYYLMTRKVGMGHGDFKLFAALGAWFGWEALPNILLIASIVGTVLGFVYLKMTKKSKETPLPFGPLLCLAGVIQLFS